MDQQTPNQPVSKSPIEAPKLPPVGFFHRHQRSIWLTLGGVALAVAALLSYILFSGKIASPPEYKGDVSITMTAPSESVSGSEISYAIKIVNLGTSKLTRATLEMFYPPGFTFIRAQSPGGGLAETEAADGRTLALQDLAGGEERNLIIVGRMEGNVREIKTVQAKLRYVPENFNSFFLAEAKASVVILPPDITLRVLGPSSTITGQVIDYEIEIRNISIEEFRDLTLELSYPPGFSYLSAVPEPASGENSWQIQSLPPAGTKIIKVKGRLTEKPGEEVYLAAELFIPAEEGKLSAGRSYVFTRVLDSPLLLTQKLIGGEGTIFGGETLQYEINYENVGEIGLSNVTISMKLESNVFDLAKSKSTTGQLRGSEVVWLPGAVPELRTVQVGQRGKFTLQMPIRAENLLTQKNPVAQTRMQFSAEELSEPIAGEALVLKIGTNMNVVSTVNLLSGPEDPTVGQTSVYLVTLLVKNTVNDVENAELTARVPDSTAVFDAGSLEPEDERVNVDYVAPGGLLRWRLGKIFAYSGTLHSARTISFRISVTPEKKPSGRPILLSDVEVTGLDSFTQEQIFSNKIDRIDGK